MSDQTIGVRMEVELGAEHIEKLRKLAAEIDLLNVGETRAEYTAEEAFCIVLNNGDPIPLDISAWCYGWAAQPEEGWPE